MQVKNIFPLAILSIFFQFPPKVRTAFSTLCKGYFSNSEPAGVRLCIQTRAALFPVVCVKCLILTLSPELRLICAGLLLISWK